MLFSGLKCCAYGKWQHVISLLESLHMRKQSAMVTVGSLS